MVFDACRKELKLEQKGNRSLLRPKGFKPIRETVRDMLIAYATAEGEHAADEHDGIGFWAEALTRWITKPGFEASTMFRKVQLDVYYGTRQAPWFTHGALKPVYFARSTESDKRRARFEIEVERAWLAVKSLDRAALLAFARRYKGTVHAEMALERARSLKRGGLRGGLTDSMKLERPQSGSWVMSHHLAIDGAASANF